MKEGFAGLGFKRQLFQLLSTELGAELCAFLEDPLVDEIRLNVDGEVWQRRLGRHTKVEGLSLGPQVSMKIIQAISAAFGETCNADHPFVFGGSSDSSERFQAAIPPLTPAPLFLIRCGREAAATHLMGR